MIEKKDGKLTEHEASVHLDDLEKLAAKLYKKFKFQISKFNFRLKFYSPQSAAQLHAFLIALNAEDMASFAKQPEISYQMYDYLIGILTKLRDGA